MKLNEVCDLHFLLTTFQLLPMIVACGKTINFLKLNTVTSELVSYSSSVVTDPIDLIMSPEQVQLFPPVVCVLLFEPR